MIEIRREKDWSPELYTHQNYIINYAAVLNQNLIIVLQMIQQDIPLA